MTLAVGHRHHAELLPHVDGLRAIADDIGTASASVLARRLDAELQFVNEQLIPHMEMAERTVYPELERILEDPRAMAPLRREHGEIRRLIADAGRACARLEGEKVPVHDEIALRRILYRMFALMRVHLYEEERYLGIIDRNEAEEGRAELVAAMSHATFEGL